MSEDQWANCELLVSIIMPVYRASETINTAVSSVLNQTYLNWELILVNDGCPEQSYKNIEEMSVDQKIIILHHENNRGVAEARNTGIRTAKGELIAFLDADDSWFKNKLEKQIKKVLEGHLIVCSNYIRKSGLLEKTEVRHKEVFNFIDMLKSNQIGNLTGMYRCDRLGKFYQKPIGHEDYLMWLQIIKKAGKGYCIQQPLAYYRVSNDSISANKLKAVKWQWRIYREELGITVIPSTYFFLHYLKSAIIKRS